MSEEIVKQSATLRVQGKFQEAIQLIELNLNQFDEITLLPALLNGYYAAQGANDHSKEKSFAKLIASEDPNVPL
jgi:hypothetical protein